MILQVDEKYFESLLLFFLSPRDIFSKLKELSHFLHNVFFDFLYYMVSKTQTLASHFLSLVLEICGSATILLIINMYVNF